ncbi:helix-turn-helix domain-containing protein [Erythrobacter sp. JK5]|uniref:helix-turn-helix domain-containing protein n=1 Tax=Erythrobacter sp. JK5 TaxID=2829500 RepID=UPI001BA49A6C|nr:helix-turn-helix domain-containing protein [Erythrobacter sp. JK5]QUL38775.1 helix-turn-helix domain-containing protein [Erythrobacter sp. JK5]
MATLRRRSGIETKTLAARSGMSPNYVWRLEQGLVVPNLRNIARLAISLEVPLPILLEKVDVSSVRLENRAYNRRDAAE